MPFIRAVIVCVAQDRLDPRQVLVLGLSTDPDAMTVTLGLELLGIFEARRQASLELCLRLSPPVRQVSAKLVEGVDMPLAEVLDCDVLARREVEQPDRRADLLDGIRRPCLGANMLGDAFLCRVL